MENPNLALTGGASASAGASATTGASASAGASATAGLSAGGYRIIDDRCQVRDDRGQGPRPVGTTWTWTLTASTTIHAAGQNSVQAKLATGDRVVVGGPVVSGARGARLIRISAAGSTAASGSRATQGQPVAQ